MILVAASTAALRVDVSVSRSLDVPAKRAAAIFDEFQWQRGGGLPVYVQARPPDESGHRRRLVAPLLLEETLLREADREFEYAVTGSGLMGSDLVANSHRGVVKFADDDRGCALTWAVTFEAADNWRAALWQRVTENVIDTAAGNLAAYVATPLLHETELALPNCASPAAARDAFLDFVWERGGGLPVPPPLALGGERERLQLPPGLRERVVAVDDASVTYRVDNPGWGTYPVSHHRGRVSFTQAQAGGEGVRLRWLVAVRPLPGAAPLVKGFTRTIVNTLALNLRAHLDGDDDVSLRGPRGAGGEWGAIAADTWLGRVLKAHKGDRRGALEQAAAAARPWTWGAAPDDPQPLSRWREGAAPGDDEAAALVAELDAG